MRQFLADLAVVLLLTSCGKMKQPEFLGVQNVKMGKFNLGKSEVIVQVKFYNPNSFDASVKSAAGEAWLDSSYLGKFVVDEKIKVPAKKEFVVPVKLSMDMKQFATLALKFSKIEEIKEVHMKATGTIRAGRNGFYKNVPINYEGKQDVEKLLGGMKF
jgi:LEA14-like dessication related protein